MTKLCVDNWQPNGQSQKAAPLQGIEKAWANYNAASGFISKSLNISGMGGDTVGLRYFYFINLMADTDYQQLGQKGQSQGNNLYVAGGSAAEQPLTTQYYYAVTVQDASRFNSSAACFSISGELAA